MLLSSLMIEIGTICLKKIASTKDEIVNYLFVYLADKRGLKYSLNLQVQLYKEKDGGNIHAKPHFRSNDHVVLNNDNVEIDRFKPSSKIFY